MTTEAFTDSGEIRSWQGIGNERVALLRYDESLPLDKSALTLTSDGGICVFASPPLYADPEVIVVKNWSREVPDLVKQQGKRHVFIGDKHKIERLGPSPKYVDG
jgi:hypothetical protein